MPGKIHVPVTVATNGFDKLQRTFGRLKGVAVGVTAALGGLAAAARAIDFTGAAIQGARDLERNYAGLESVFKDNTDQMKEFGRTASEMGLSMNEAAKATTFIGSVLKQSGFSIAETADLTEELVELGADLALTYGYDVQEALLGMTALFRGEYDPIEKFGVAMKQSEIDAEKAARGLDGLTGAAERFADQQIRVEFLMERASDAMGAFERQSGNLTVQQMRLRAEFENVRDTVGADLLPVVAEFIGGIREIVDDTGPKLERSFRNLTPVLDRLGKDVLPLIATAVDGVIAGFDIVIGVLDEMTDPTSELNESLDDLGDSLADLFGDVDTEKGNEIATTIDAISGSIKFLVDRLKGLVDFINSHPWLLDLLGITIGARLVGRGGAGKKAAQGGDSATGNLAGIAAGITAVGVAFKALPKPLIGVGIIGAIIGENVYGPLRDANEGILETSQSFDIATDSADDFRESFAASAVIAQNPYGTLANEIGNVTDFQVEYNKKLKETGLTQIDFNSELSNGAKLAEELGMQDGLPTWFDSVKESANEATNAALGFKEAGIQVLELELLDLMRAKRFATGDALTTLEASILPIRDALIELKKERGDYLTGDDDDGATDEARDYVKEFFDGIAEGIRKESARLDLQELGLSQALIDQILGSEGWAELFQTIIDGGADMARQLQDDFNKTAKGIQETQKAAEELAAEQKRIADEIAAVNQRITDAQNDYLDSVKDARKEFAKFTDNLNLTVDGLKTYEREIGRFESRTRSDLQRIEDQVNSAFDNGYLLEDARDNLLEYARAEFQVLLDIQQQRDTLLRKRNAAADVIFGVASAVTSAGNITQLLRDVQDEVKEVQVKELFEDVVESADGLNGFKVTLERNYTEVVKDTVNKSQSLVNNFQAVIDRTKNFIANLKELRKMGLDPFLFQQLVDAGAEAGGATAQALVEGGKDTVNEVNSLQKELEALGTELGEETYEVTKDSGNQFVSGIIDGIDEELQRLEDAAVSLATGFTQAFAEAMQSSMDIAFEGILDGIRDEFEKLMAELTDLLNDLEEEQQKVQSSVQYDSEGMPQVVITPEPPPRDMPQTIITPDSPSAPDFSYNAPPRQMPGGAFGGPGGFGQTFNIFNVSNPLDAYNASKGNVEQQSTYQSSNGDIAVTLAGVGN